MLFRLQYVENHDLEKVQELLTYFFQKLQTATVWDKTLFPNWYHPIFNKGLKFEEEILKYVFTKIQELLPFDFFHPDSVEQRRNIYLNFIDSNNIKEICNNQNATVTDFSKLGKDNIILKITPYNTKGQNLITNLYKDVLSKENLISAILDLDSVKNHYESFYTINPKICTFCGQETIPEPITIGRADYDHYLDKAKYAFSSVNMRNLIPIGKHCNSLVKGTKNILVDEDGNRCLAFYPYEEREELIFSAECIKPPSSFYGGEWSITITPKNASESTSKKVYTWNRVFNIIAIFAKHIQNRCKELFKWIIEEAKECDNNIKEAIDKIVTIFSEEKRLISLRGHIGYIPEKVFYEYCQSHSEFLSKYQVILNRNISTMPIYSELD